MNSIRLHTGWEFSRDRENWVSVNVPHDWAIGADFDRMNDPSGAKTDANGNTVYEHTGRTGGLPIVGEGWYRYKFERPAAAVTEILFDGVMSVSDVTLNGKRIGNGHSGYFPFLVNATNALTDGENTLEVHAVVRPDSSRWYCGAGIIRNVHLRTAPATHIASNGICVRVTEISEQSATVTVTAEAIGKPKDFTVCITAPDGKEIAATTVIPCGNIGTAKFTVENPVLWEVGVGNVYTATATVTDRAGETDTESVSFGIRTAEFTADKGFFLNGRHVMLNGVCQHHDNGILGAAVNVYALRQKLEALRKIGVNAIRTSHNPPSPEFLALADEMGFLVLEEFFDEWMRPKVKNGYSQFFCRSARPDMREIIRRDRNHPCVIMWSIGNEIGEQGTEDGWKIAADLKAYARKFDDRPITMGLDNGGKFAINHMGEVADVIGLNYKPTLYEKFHALYPDKPMYGSETASCVSLRSVYHLDCTPEIPARQYEDLSVNAYDFTAPAWAYYAERDFAYMADNPFIAGQFVWTGTDYLGEPTPYQSEWPARSSYFGILDTVLLPKNRAWLYQAECTDTPTVHVFPHWNWQGHEGEEISVCVFTSAQTAELFLNGVSLGCQTRKQAGEGVADWERYRLIWKVPYTAGTLKAVAYDTDGNVLCEDEVRTAGEPASLRLTAIKSALVADGEDVTLVYATLTDGNGTPCETASANITFAVTGAGTLCGTDNGDPRDTNGFANPTRATLGGICACAVQAADNGGTLTVTATSDNGLKAEIAITVG